MNQVLIKIETDTADTLLRPWNDPERGAVYNTPTVNANGRTVISGVTPGEKRGWWELPPELASKLEDAVRAANASAPEFRFDAVVSKVEAPRGYSVILSSFLRQ